MAEKAAICDIGVDPVTGQSPYEKVLREKEIKMRDTNDINHKLLTGREK